MGAQKAEKSRCPTKSSTVRRKHSNKMKREWDVVILLIVKGIKSNGRGTPNKGGYSRVGEENPPKKTGLGWYPKPTARSNFRVHRKKRANRKQNRLLGKGGRTPGKRWLLGKDRQRSSTRRIGSPSNKKEGKTGREGKGARLEENGGAICKSHRYL